MLKGKTALITGSTSGIGLGIAHALAAEGANIVINGFGAPDEISRVENELKSHKVRTLYHGADMSKPVAIEAMIGAAESSFGQVDILVNNAGIQHVAPIESFPVDRWDAIIAINLSSAFHTTRLVLPKMKQRNWGRIINVASVHGLVGLGRKVGVCRRQARRRRSNQVSRFGDGANRSDVQCDLPGLGADSAGAATSRRACRA